MKTESVFTLEEKVAFLETLEGQLPSDLVSLLKTNTDLVGFSDGQNFFDVYWNEFKDLCTLYLEEKDTLTFRMDYISNLIDLECDYMRYHSTMPEDVKEAFLTKMKDLEEQLAAKIAEYGYKRHYSHASGEFVYAWWDVLIPMKNWDRTKFLDIWKLFNDLNLELNKLVDTYGF